MYHCCVYYSNVLPVGQNNDIITSTLFIIEADHILGIEVPWPTTESFLSQVWYLLDQIYNNWNPELLNKRKEKGSVAHSDASQNNVKHNSKHRLIIL